MLNARKYLCYIQLALRDINLISFPLQSIVMSLKLLTLYTALFYRFALIQCFYLLLYLFMCFHLYTIMQEIYYQRLTELLEKALLQTIMPFIMYSI